MHAVRMDVFDSEPYLGLVPRRWLRLPAWVALLAIVFVPGLSEWSYDQAVQHVRHQVQPLIERLIEQTAPSAPGALNSSTAVE